MVDRLALYLVAFEQDDHPSVVCSAVPVVNGVPLRERLGSDAAEGIHPSLLSDGGREWLGRPYEKDRMSGSPGHAELLRGTCGFSDCCGVFARIDHTAEHVTWTDWEFRGESDEGRSLIRFTFDPVSYRTAILGGLASQPIEVPRSEWREDRSESDGHLYLRSVLGL